MLDKLKSYMMPISMLLGIVFYNQVSELSFLPPYLIAVMLYLTFCNISFRNVRFSKLYYWLLAIQVLASVAAYLILSPINLILAQAALICIFAPTATSAPVITGMLGGNVESLIAYSLLSNMAVAILAPFYFSLMGNVDGSNFGHSLLIVAERVGLLLLIPLALAYLQSKFLPMLHSKVKKVKFLSFYLWNIALIIVTGKTIKFIIEQENPNIWLEIGVALVSLVVCVSQFLLGRRFGRQYNDTIAGGQGLGQKNTILGIWMAQTYLNPIASLGPGSYVLWQNIVNSYQVWRTRKSK